MSDVKISGQAVGTSGVAPSTARPAQVEKGAGVGTARPAQPADRVAVGGEPAAKAAATPELAVQSGGNPFAALPGRDIPFESLRLTERAVDLAQSVELPFEALQNLAAAEGKLGAEHAEAFSKLREGVMLLTADAQSARARAGLKLDDLGKISGKLAQSGQPPTTKELEGVLLAPRPPGALPIDINAFVQQVLRESYMMQCELLRDYADKVKFYNELKKKIRAQLGKAREMQSAWVGAAKGDENFRADTPFEWVEFDGNGNPYTPALAGDELAAWQGTGQAMSADSSAPAAPGPSKVQTMIDGAYGASRLTPEETAKLNAMLTGDANYLEGKAGDIIALLPKMNNEDFNKYVAPMMKTLTKASKGAVAVDIFEAMNPVQRLVLVRQGHEEEWLGLGSSNSKTFQTGAYNAMVWVAEKLGKVWPMQPSASRGYNGMEVKIDGHWTLANYKGTGRPEVKGAMAADMVDDLKALVARQKAEAPPAQVEETAGSATAAPSEPANVAKSISTKEQMEAYIKKLEETLNTAGDDSQLANVDLQNALQRQQQTLQMMSNMSKMLHDTAMSIIRKIGG